MKSSLWLGELPEMIELAELNLLPHVGNETANFIPVLGRCLSMKVE
jgi:hypothetical protein